MGIVGQQRLARRAVAAVHHPFVGSAMTEDRQRQQLRETLCGFGDVAL